MKNWKRQAAMLAIGVSVGAGGNIALNEPEVQRIIEKYPEIVEVTKAYRFNTKEEFVARKKELIDKSRDSFFRQIPMKISDFEELSSLIALESVTNDSLVLRNFSGTAQKLFSDILDMEYQRQ
jgi:hypothetical protein